MFKTFGVLNNITNRFLRKLEPFFRHKAAVFVAAAVFAAVDAGVFAVMAQLLYV